MSPPTRLRRIFVAFICLLGAAPCAVAVRSLAHVAAAAGAEDAQAIRPLTLWAASASVAAMLGGGHAAAHLPEGAATSRSRDSFARLVDFSSRLHGGGQEDSNGDKTLDGNMHFLPLDMDADTVQTRPWRPADDKDARMSNIVGVLKRQRRFSHVLDAETLETLGAQLQKKVPVGPVDFHFDFNADGKSLILQVKTVEAGRESTDITPLLPAFVDNEFAGFSAEVTSTPPAGGGNKQVKRYLFKAYKGLLMIDIDWVENGRVKFRYTVFTDPNLADEDE